MSFRRVSGDDHAVVIVGGPHIHTHRLSTQLIRGKVRVFQSLPGQLQYNALLGIHVGGLHRRKSEELGIKARNVIQVTTHGVCVSDACAHHLITGIFRPTANRQVGQTIPTRNQLVPHLTDIVRAGVTPRHANNGNVVHIRGIDVAAYPGGAGLCRGSGGGCGAVDKPFR